MVAAGVIWCYEVNAAKTRIVMGAIQALASVSREITFSAEESGLCLSGIPEGQACYGEIRLHAHTFFGKVQRSEGNGFGCKVLAKSILPALRRATARPSSGGVSATYTLSIRHEHSAGKKTDDAPRLCFEIVHEDGARRRWRLFYEESDSAFVPDFDATSVAEVAAAPIQFLSIFAHVGSGSIEISFDDGLLVTGTPSDFDQVTGAHTSTTKRALSQIRISEADLDICHLPASSQHNLRLCFHAKQLKALAKFAEIAGASILRLRCTQAGEPISLDVDSPAGATASFLVSTAIPLHLASNLQSSSLSAEYRSHNNNNDDPGLSITAVSSSFPSNNGTGRDHHQAHHAQSGAPASSAFATPAAANTAGAPLSEVCPSAVF